MVEVRVWGVVVVNTNKGWWRSQKNRIQGAASLMLNSIICTPKQRWEERGGVGGGLPVLTRSVQPLKQTWNENVADVCDSCLL